MNRKCRHLDLFTGCGGFALAARWVWGDDYYPVAFCEIKKRCHETLIKNFGNVPIYSDIRTFDGKQYYKKVDIITGGDPCQPHSLSGKRLGPGDDRFLWPEMLRIIKEVRPTWIINENVIGSISNLVLDNKISDLENIGYAARPYNIPACAVGALHERKRIWIIGKDDAVSHGVSERCEKRPKYGFEQAKRTERSGEDAVRHDHRVRQKEKNMQLRENEKISISSSTSKNALCHTNGSGSFWRKWWRAGAEFIDGSRWAIEPPICGVVDGLPDRVDRIEMLGNSIVPPVAKAFFAAIKKVEEINRQGIKEVDETVLSR